MEGERIDGPTNPGGVGMDVATQAAKAAWKYLRTATVYTGTDTASIGAPRGPDGSQCR